MNRPQGILRGIVWFVAVLAAALLQATWPDMLKLQGVVPDLVLLMVVFFALVEGEERAMYTAVLGGIYQDVATNAVLGHHVFCLVVVAYGIGRMSNRLVTEHPAIKAGLVLMGGIVEGIIYVAILYVQNPGIGAMTMIIASAVPSAFYTAMLTPLAFPVLARLFQRAEPPLYGGAAP